MRCGGRKKSQENKTGNPIVRIVKNVVACGAFVPQSLDLEPRSLLICKGGNNCHSHSTQYFANTVLIVSLPRSARTAFGYSHTPQSLDLEPRSLLICKGGYD